MLKFTLILILAHAPLLWPQRRIFALIWLTVQPWGAGQLSWVIIEINPAHSNSNCWYKSSMQNQFSGLRHKPRLWFYIKVLLHKLKKKIKNSKTHNNIRFFSWNFSLSTWKAGFPLTCMQRWSSNPLDLKINRQTLGYREGHSQYLVRRYRLEEGYSP